MLAPLKACALGYIVFRHTWGRSGGVSVAIVPAVIGALDVLPRGVDVRQLLLPIFVCADPNFHGPRVGRADSEKLEDIEGVVGVG